MTNWADKQTLEDLNILGKFKKNSIINIFDRTATRQGQLLLENMFREPLGDVGKINERKETFRYFASLGLSFPFGADDFDKVESYLNSHSSGGVAGACLSVLIQKAKHSFASTEEYPQMRDSIAATLRMLSEMEGFLRKLPSSNLPFYAATNKFRGVFKSTALRKAIEGIGQEKLSLVKVLRYNTLLRITFRRELEAMLAFIYELDIYISVAAVANERGFSYAEALPLEAHITEIEQLFHPALTGGVANDLRIDRQKNVIFLTGANMAGKSTLMKSFGTAVYLAHIGFPVPARSMRFSMLDGMYTSINVPDNIDMGYSHFYAEVLRVKKVAQDVAAGKNMLIIFDELFKGTNVKDAFDATVAVTESFARKTDCQFIISTHIIEAGAELGKRCSNLQFLYLPTVMDGNRPTYTYKLREGITDDRHGMMIINNEHIVDIIMGKQKKEL